MTAAPLSALRERVQARLDLLLALLLLLAGLVLLGAGLDHPSIHNWDESAHQAVTRGTFATPFWPHLFEHVLWPDPPKEWMSAGTFLHKPTGPFWLGALAMHLVGITPLALRLGSLLGMLLAAQVIYGVGRRATNRAVAFLGGLVFLGLPFGYELTQGYLFGDATDCTLVGAVALAIALLVVAVERQDRRFAAAAGVATGVAYLCKSALGLVPAGVAALLFVVAWRRWAPGLTFRALALFVLALVLTAAPWNLYCAFAYPAEYAYEAHHTLAHLFTDEIAQWVRPVDAIVNEINETELRPVPICLPMLALLWAWVRTLRQRETVVIAVTAWVTATWIVLSIAHAKVPAVAWGAVPGALVLLVVLVGDALRFPALAGAVLAAAATPKLLELAPDLERWPKLLPLYVPETRTHPVLLIGLLAAGLGALVGAFAGAVVRRGLGPVWLARVVTGLQVVAVLIAFLGLAPVAVARAAAVRRDAPDASIAPMRELGQAIDRVLPKGDAMLFNQLDRDPGCCFLLQDLTFWSGKTNYRREPDVEKSHAAGLHPYLVSNAAEPFAPVPGIPGFAAGRLYDLEQPAEPAPLPADVTRFAAPVEGWGCRVLGWAVGPRDREHDVWSLYLEGVADSFAVPLFFVTAAGEQRASLGAVDTYSDPKHWHGKPWFEATVVGPHRADVLHLRVGGVSAF